MFRATTLLGGLICLLMLATAAPAQEGDQPVLDEKEQAFVKLLTGARLTGQFTILKPEAPNTPDSQEAPAHEESYEIKSVEKVQIDPALKPYWLINSRMKFGKTDVILPVPVKVHWADDTPVISLTDVKIPGLGEGFSCRVLFYDDQYAGTWAHGKIRGQMFGRISHPEATKAP